MGMSFTTNINVFKSLCHFCCYYVLKMQPFLACPLEMIIKVFNYYSEATNSLYDLKESTAFLI